uniref:Uncharacterized protein n=1 Tax=Arundo donax TaxID=35708 RepID=A0A0A9AB78_ARUDO
MNPATYLAVFPYR